MIRVALTSYWTAAAAWAVMTALHWRWLARSTHAGDVLSAYGAGLVALGIAIAARPFIKDGIERTARSQVPQLPFGFVAPDPEGMRPFLEHQEAAYEHFRREVIAERVVAVLVIVVGTLLNGWGTPLARRWGLPI